ncbi:hypothetical protein D3C73_1551510 [compost metagenome]
MQAGDRDWQLGECQRQHPGAHGGGKPVRGELANGFQRMVQMTQGSNEGLTAVRALHDELLSSGEVEPMVELNRISI